MKWNVLQTQGQIDKIIERSKSKPCLIFKHSISCPISSMAKSRVERGWNISEESLEVYYLDLINYRSVSNYIADVFQVEHQSPQVLLIENGTCLFNTSHLDITVKEIKEKLSKVA